MKIIKIGIYVLVLFSLLFSSCKDQMEDHYARPDWLKGNTYFVLKEKGSYNLFLTAIDVAGYRDVLEGKGLCTVFAPNDDAFNAYLKANGYSGISEIDLAELKMLVGQHIVQYAFSTSQLLNFQPLGMESMEPYPAGLCYKQQTFAKKATEVNGKAGIFHKEKYLPIISTELFKTRKISNPEADYHYFYPGSTWHGSENKLYAANAGVVENGIPTDNGYLYPIGAVICPLKTVYEVLKNKEADFSLFLTQYDRFKDMKYDADLSKKYAAPGDSLFLFYHKELPKIASEWTYNDENPGSSFFYKHISRSFNVFAPNNTALQSYLIDFFENNYTSYADVPLLTIYYLLQNHTKLGDIILPDNIRQGESSVYGDIYNFDVDRDVVHRELCSNGVFYGIDKVVTPAMFRSVTGPVFKSNTYSIFAYILHKATELTQLINLDAEYTLLIPTDEVLQKDYALRMNYGNGKFGSEKLEVEEDGQWKTCPDDLIRKIAEQHIIFEKIIDFETPQVYRTKGSFTYVIVEQSGIRGEGTSLITPSKKWDAANGGITNGVTYEVNSLLAKSPDDVVVMLQKSSEFTKFYSKLIESEMIDKQGKFTFLLSGDNLVVFAPTDEALSQVTLPTDKKELAEYLGYFFISATINNLGDYILPGFGMDGFYQTQQVDRENSTQFETVYHKIKVEDGKNKLRITNKAGTTSLNTHEGFPMFAKDGAIYTIDKIIQP